MKRTTVSTLLLLVAIGAALAGLLQAVLASVGRPIIIPPFTLPVALAAIGVIVVLMAVLLVMNGLAIWLRSRAERQAR